MALYLFRGCAFHLSLFTLLLSNFPEIHWVVSFISFHLTMFTQLGVCYMLWFNFILAWISNFICFLLIHYQTAWKQRKIKTESRIKLYLRANYWLISPSEGDLIMGWNFTRKQRIGVLLKLQRPKKPAELVNISLLSIFSATVYIPVKQFSM